MMMTNKAEPEAATPAVAPEPSPTLGVQNVNASVSFREEERIALGTDLRSLYRKARISQRVGRKSFVFGKDLPRRHRRTVTKTAHLKRTMTDFNMPAATAKGSARTKFVGQNMALQINEPHDSPSDGKERVQIIEDLDSPLATDEAKGSDMCKDTDRRRHDRVTKQIVEAEELIAQLAKTSIDMECFNSPHEDPLNIGVDDEDVDDAETELEVTVGSIECDTALLVTSDRFLIVWPTEMLPGDVRQGQKFMIVIRRNSNSEALRENAVWTLQNQIAALVSGAAKSSVAGDK